MSEYNTNQNRHHATMYGSLNISYESRCMEYHYHLENKSSEKQSRHTASMVYQKEVSMIVVKKISSVLAKRGG